MSSLGKQASWGASLWPLLSLVSPRWKVMPTILATYWQYSCQVLCWSFTRTIPFNPLELES